MRRYEPIWLELAEKRKATVRCRTAKVPTLIQAVKKEKSKANVQRKDLDLPFFGRLMVGVDTLSGGMSSVTFTVSLTNEAFDL